MARVIRKRQAKLDITQIWIYIAENDYDAAGRLIKQFEQAFELLSKFPRSGQVRDDLQRGLRSFPVGNYLLFYEPIKGGIEVVRVLHAARDHRRIFKR